MSDISDELQDFKQENRKEHKQIMKRQDETNGKVRQLELWKAHIQGSWATLKTMGTGTSVLIGSASGIFGGLIVAAIMKYAF